MENIENSVTSQYSYFEWRATDTDTDPLDPKQWKFHESPFKIDTESDTAIWMQIDEYISERGQRSRLDYLRNADRIILDKINNSPWPPIIATDGSHDDTDEDNILNSVFFVMLIYNRHDTTYIENALNLTWTSILARGNYLPDSIGATPSDQTMDTQNV